MSKKKKTFLIALTTLLFFGALMFSLRQPLSETRANTAAQNKLAADNKTDSVPKVDKQKPGEQEKNGSVTETTETEVKLDANTAAKSGGSSSSASSGSKSSSGSTSGSGGSSSGSTSGSGGSSGGSTSGSGGTSGGSGSSGSTTPTKPPTPKPPTPAPALKPFSVPASNSFNDVYQSTDSGRAELLIVMDSSENYEAQLNQLYSIIAPVVGSQLANQIVGYARTKTDAYISLDRSWSVSGRTLELGSTWGDWGVSFYSWRK